MKLNNKNKILSVTSFSFIYLIFCSFLVYSQDNTTTEINTIPDSYAYDQTNITQEGTNTTDNTYNSTQVNATEQTNTTQDVASQNKDDKKQADLSLQETQNQNNGGKPGDTNIVETSVATQSFDAQIYLDPNSYDFVSFGGNTLFNLNKLDEFAFYYNDFLGNVRGTFSELGGVLSSKNYLLFGGQIDNNRDYSGKAYTTKEQDENSGLYYFGARYYEPVLGRFVSVDPKYNPLETPYSYARNNPLAFIDPDGREVMIAKFIGHENIENLYRNIGGEIPQVNSIINDDLMHVFMPRDASKETAESFRRLAPKDREVDAITYSAVGTLVDISKIDSYGYADNNMILLHQLFHESVHQYDLTKIEQSGAQPPITSDLETELNIQKTIRDSLKLGLSYEVQLVNKVSWVVRSGISKQDYQSFYSVWEKTNKIYEDKKKRQDKEKSEKKEPPKDIFSPEEEERIRNTPP